MREFFYFRLHTNPAHMKTGNWKGIDLAYADNILRLTPNQTVDYDVDDLLAFHHFALEFTGSTHFLVLSDFREHQLNLSNETIQKAAKDEWLNAAKIAEAVIVKSLPNLVLARFYLHVLKPLTTTRIFKTEEAALHWLKEVDVSVAAEID